MRDLPIQTNRGLLQGHTSSAQVPKSEIQTASSDAAFSHVCAAHVLALQRYLLPSFCVRTSDVFSRTYPRSHWQIFEPTLVRFLFSSRTFDDMAVVRP